MDLTFIQSMIRVALDFYLDMEKKCHQVIWDRSAFDLDTVRLVKNGLLKIDH